MMTSGRGWTMELSCISRQPDHLVITVLNMVMLQDTHDILLTNYEDQEPVLRFDGVGGIVMSNVCRNGLKWQFFISSVFRCPG